MLDFNDEEQQSQRQYGPVPAGSKVLMKLELQRPKYSSPEDSMLARTQKGLLQLFCKLTVADGSYKGCFWYENITLPAKCQTIPMQDNMAISARIGGSLIRAIIESVRRIDPKATDGRAMQGRRINSWNELDGVEFPAVLGIDKKPFEKDGREYWNNRISRVIPCTDKEFPTILRGGEIITDGPVTGNAQSKNSAAQKTATSEAVPSENTMPKANGPQYGEGGPLNTNYDTAYDDVPF